MRCLRCSARNKGEPEQYGFRCPGCGHRVAVSKKRDGFTDGAIRAALDAVAGAGKYRILPEHAAYELLRRGVTKAGKAKKLGPIGVVLIILAVVIGGLVSVSAGNVVGVFGFFCLLRWRFRARVVPLGAFRAVKKFLLVNPTDQLVPEGVALTPGDAEVELALAARRLLVCQHDRYADYLLANDYHLQSACPVVGPTPEHSASFPGIVERLRTMAGATVFVLHDLTPNGVAFGKQLRTLPQWFPDPQNTTVVDLGLNPGHESMCPGLARPLPEIRGAGGGTLAVASQLRDGEGVEVTALRPGRLMAGITVALAAGVPLAAAAAAGSSGGSGGSDDGG